MVDDDQPGTIVFRLQRYGSRRFNHERRTKGKDQVRTHREVEGFGQDVCRERLAERDRCGFHQTAAMPAEGYLDAGFQGFLNLVGIKARVASQANAVAARAVQFQNPAAPRILMETVDILGGDGDDFAGRFEPG
jgi:hypothetical protein